MAGSDGSWIAESAKETRAVFDRDVVNAAGRSFTLYLPLTAEATPLVDRTAGFDAVDLVFRVSRDEERVELAVAHGERLRWLDAREHGYVLLTLARLREQERELEESERGWVDRTALLSMLGIEGNTLDVAVFRARKQLLEAGLEGAARIVEVRRGFRRLGTDRFRIERS